MTKVTSASRGPIAVRTAFRPSTLYAQPIAITPLLRSGPRALGDKPEGDTRPDISPDQPDFWEGESFELLGQISSFALPIFIVLALAVGFFASSTYNNDADVFLDSPRSDADTAKLYKFE